MSNQDGFQPDQTDPAPRRRKGRVKTGVLTGLAALVLGIGVTVGVMGITGWVLHLPQFAVSRIVARMDAALTATAPDARLDVAGIGIDLSDHWTPRLQLQDLRLSRRQSGAVLLALPETLIGVDAASLMEGKVRPRSLRLTGAQVTLLRDKDGSFDLAFGAARMQPVDSIPAAFALIDQAFAQPNLRHLERVEADALSVTYRDLRLGRTWQLGDGRLVLENRETELRSELALSLAGGDAGDGGPAQALVTAISAKGASSARITAHIDRVPAADLAAQIMPLAPLGVLDAPISGQLALSLGAEGFTALQAGLSLGAGALRPTPASEPIAFDRASLSLAYDPAQGRMLLTGLEVDGSALRLRATGHSYLQAADGSMLTGPLGHTLPRSFLTQIDLTEMMVDPKGLFQKPLRFDEGAVDLRLSLNPFQVEIGQAVLMENGHRLAAHGKITASDKGWGVALDLTTDEMERQAVLGLWPVNVLAKTRQWLSDNLITGTLRNGRAIIRINPGEKPNTIGSFDFTDGELRYLKGQPHVVGGQGYATLEGARFTLVVTRGHVIAPRGGVVDAANSVFHVEDIHVKPSIVQLRLNTKSSLTGILSLLDAPPFGFLTKADRPVDLGFGRAEMSGEITFPLKPKIEFSDVAIQVAGAITGFESVKLVPDHAVRADRLAVSATHHGMTLAGPGRVGDVDFDVSYHQDFGASPLPPATIEGVVELSPDTVQEFGLGLRDGMLTGQGMGQISVSLPKGTPATLSLVSDLNRIALDIPGTGWTKPAATRGRLDMQATLATPAHVDSLTLDAPGMQAKGEIWMKEKGLDRAEFSSVKIGNWFDGRVKLTGRKTRPVAVDIATDFLRMGEVPDLTAGISTGGGADMDIPITIAIDQLRISDGIALNRFSGDFTPRGGINGNFTALLNGDVPLAGTVAPSKHGPAVRITAEDAGATVASAGIFDSARGGALELRLTPTGERDTYDGVAQISNIRVADAPVLAELLSALSVVGMLEQLNGAGLLFSKATGEFILTPGHVDLQRGSAVGASLGVSMAGSYDLDTENMFMQGVVSPFYLVNGIGAAITRKGEGVFGFNYSVKGTAAGAVVSVNPLSILTPGLFRDIFRANPPKVSQGNGG